MEYRDISEVPVLDIAEGERGAFERMVKGLSAVVFSLFELSHVLELGNDSDEPDLFGAVAGSFIMVVADGFGVSSETLAEVVADAPQHRFRYPDDVDGYRAIVSVNRDERDEVPDGIGDTGSVASQLIDYMKGER